MKTGLNYYSFIPVFTFKKLRLSLYNISIISFFVLLNVSARRCFFIKVSILKLTNFYWQSEFNLQSL
jgi:hypothetical protein